MINLGFPLINAPELATPSSMWCLEVRLNDKESISVAYTAEQAKEIARRIINFYGVDANQVGAHHAGNVLGGPEVL